MHTGGAGLLGDAADGVFDILADDHHQIGQLVDDDGDIGHLLEVRVRCRQLIEGLDVADVVLREEVVAALHLLHCAAQCAGRLARLGDDGHQQVGDAVVLSQLDDLGVDEQELDVLGAGAEQQAHDDALPLPVLPAMSRWGILHRSATWATPAMSLPSAMPIGEVIRKKLWLSKTLRM